MGLYRLLFGKKADHNRRYKKFSGSAKQKGVISKVIAKQKRTGKVRTTRGFFG